MDSIGKFDAALAGALVALSVSIPCAVAFAVLGRSPAALGVLAACVLAAMSGVFLGNTLARK